MEVKLYSTAAGRNVVAEFLLSLPSKDTAKIFHTIELLAKLGAELHEPHTKHVDGSIWELRIKFSSNIYRIFYFIYTSNDGNEKLVLLHGFVKKTRKTPPSEIELAKKRQHDFVKRYC